MRGERAFVRLPYPLKVLAASAEGARLRRWRYGPDLEASVAEARAREAWTAEKWASWQEQQVAQVLRQAATLPLYAGGAGARGDLTSWPVLTKQRLRRAPVRSNVVRGCGPLYEEHTSGSTGTPLRLHFTRRVLHAYYAIYEQRVRRWNGVDVRSPWAILGGRVVADVGRHRPPYWVWNRTFRQLYLSVYHLSAATVGAYGQAMERHRVEYVVGYPSAMAELARSALDAGVALPPVRACVANAEPVSDAQRAIVEEAFGAPLRATYGMSELTLAASECAAGAMHLWPEVGHLEVLDEHDLPVAPGVVGRAVATSLLNADTPLVRYEVGDLVALLPSGDPCPCGSGLPRLAAIEGRLDDVITCPDGRRVGRLDPVFKADLPIVEAQIEQVGRAHVVVRVVPAAGYDDRSAASIVERLRDRIGPMEVEVRPVDAVPRGPGGKFRAVIGLPVGGKG